MNHEVIKRDFYYDLPEKITDLYSAELILSHTRIALNVLVD